ncbi:iron-containing alcohol dehydrogenase, partial [Blautia pseudococcoides]|nr:iron-containing alcohol dehydrogenase [Blautia pseudococcoides]
MEEFGIKTSIHFGKNALEYLKKLQGAGICIVTDPFMVESGLVENITRYLKAGSYTIFSNVVPDPPLELVIEGVKEVIKQKPDTLIALGGGS